MTYDRPIIISAGKSRKDINWQRQTLTVSELYDRLKTPARGVEALSEYTKMKKAQQDDLKDVGGFVAGALAGGRRKANAVTGRDVITLDFDNVPGWQTDAVLATLDGLKCNYCVYSTRKHAPNAPQTARFDSYGQNHDPGRIRALRPAYGGLHRHQYGRPDDL